MHGNWRLNVMRRRHHALVRAVRMVAFRGTVDGRSSWRIRRLPGAFGCICRCTVGQNAIAALFIDQWLDECEADVVRIIVRRHCRIAVIGLAVRTPKAAGHTVRRCI